MGTALLTANLCYLAKGQPCDYCVLRCPLKSGAIAFGRGGLSEVNESVCAGCGVCAYLCPTDAVRIVPSVVR